jgi:C4-type Zn-finger protein
MKKLFRKSGKEQAAKCPVCGKYMDKEILREYTQTYPVPGKIQIELVAISAWYCKDCNQEGKA